MSSPALVVSGCDVLYCVSAVVDCCVVLSAFMLLCVDENECVGISCVEVETVFSCDEEVVVDMLLPWVGELLLIDDMVISRVELSGFEELVLCCSVLSVYEELVLCCSVLSVFGEAVLCWGVLPVFGDWVYSCVVLGEFVLGSALK